MRLSTRARYALRMTLDMAKNGGVDSPVSLAAVAARTRISQGYMEHLAALLRKAGLLRGVLGKLGGYQLAKPPQAITLRQVIEAAIGPISILECVANPEMCMRNDDCECRLVYALINRRITQAMDELTLADLLNPSWALEMRSVLAGTGAAEA